MSKRAKHGPAPRRARLALAALALAAGCSRAGEAPARAPHLLLISIDTLRADHLGCYGYAKPTSPGIDALAARSWRCEDAWAPMAMTLPSHAAMLTSLAPHTLGVLDNATVVPDALVDSLAERLAAAGYDTAAFVSSIPLASQLGLDQGFALYDEPLADERIAEATVARAAAWIAERARTEGEAPAAKPFFAFVHLVDPHTWYSAPAAERAELEAGTGLQPPFRIFPPTRPELDLAARRQAVGGYDAEIRYADSQVERLLGELERLGLAGETIVCLTSDHGETLDELYDAYGYAFDHGEFLHARELRVPLLLHVPAGRAGAGQGAVPDLVTLLDVAPTLLELCGVTWEGRLEGRSLAPLLEGGALPGRPAFAARRALEASEIADPPSPFLVGDESSVATREWQRVRCEGRPAELFDRRAAANPEVDVASLHPEIAEALDRLLDDWLALRGDGVPTGAERALDPDLRAALRALGYTSDP